MAPSTKVEKKEAEPETPSMGPALRQMALLPVIWGSSKLNLDHPDNLFILQIVFSCVITLLYGSIQFALYRASRSNNTTRVLNPGTSQYIKDEDKAADGSVAAWVYDKAKINESKMQLTMSACITTFIHLQWKYTQPLLMICLMQPMQLWDNPAMHIHLRGKSGEGYVRPWKKPQADNPLAAWAERKKEEAEKTAQEEEKKAVKGGKKD